MSNDPQIYGYIPRDSMRDRHQNFSASLPGDVTRVAGREVQPVGVYDAPMRGSAGCTVRIFEHKHMQVHRVLRDMCFDYGDILATEMCPLQRELRSHLVRVLLDTTAISADEMNPVNESETI